MKESLTAETYINRGDESRLSDPVVPHGKGAIFQRIKDYLLGTQRL